MKEKTTYLLPIWVDIDCYGDPKDVLIDLNDKLTEFFETYVDDMAENSNSINIRWSANQHIDLRRCG